MQLLNSRLWEEYRDGARQREERDRRGKPNLHGPRADFQPDLFERRSNFQQLSSRTFALCVCTSTTSLPHTVGDRDLSAPFIGGGQIIERKNEVPNIFCSPPLGC